MKQLLLILSTVLLFSCANEQGNNPVLKSMPTSHVFSIGGDSCYNGSTYDTLAVSGLNSPYNWGQIANIRISFYHTNMNEISIMLYAPAPTYATYYITDFGVSQSMVGQDAVEHMRIPNDSLPYYWTSTSQYTGVYSDKGTVNLGFDETYYGQGVNGDWVLEIYNDGNSVGYLEDFTITFNY